MVATSSTMLALGAQAAPFELPDVSNNNAPIGLSNFDGKPVLIMFICNHCPFVLHILPQMVELANTAKSNGIGVVAISSNDVQSYPQDGPEHMNDLSYEAGFEFPYLYDQSQSVASLYRAACTPDFFLFDQAHTLVYRGQMDGARPGNGVAVTGADLSSAINSLLNGTEISKQQIASVGCSIKWKPDNKPGYV